MYHFLYILRFMAKWLHGYNPSPKLCPNISHLSQYDDQINYIGGFIWFTMDVDGGNTLETEKIEVIQ